MYKVGVPPMLNEVTFIETMKGKINNLSFEITHLKNVLELSNDEDHKEELENTIFYLEKEKEQCLEKIKLFCGQ